MHRDAIRQFAVVVGGNVFQIIVERKPFEHRFEFFGGVGVIVRQRLKNFKRFHQTNALVVFFGEVKKDVHKRPFFFIQCVFFNCHSPPLISFSGKRR